MDEKLARVIFIQEMIRHGLYGKWKIGWDQAKRRGGCCHKKTKAITISVYHVALNDEKTVRNTILHEIAHALAFEQGLDDSHGPKWKKIALSIGCDGKRCHDGEVAKGNFSYECPSCKTEVRTHRRLKRKSACRSCCAKYSGGRFDKRFVFELRGKYVRK